MVQGQVTGLCCSSGARTKIFLQTLWKPDALAKDPPRLEAHGTETHRGHSSYQTFSLLQQRLSNSTWTEQRWWLFPAEEHWCSSSFWWLYCKQSPMQIFNVPWQITSKKCWRTWLTRLMGLGEIHQQKTERKGKYKSKAKSAIGGSSYKTLIFSHV